MLVLAAAALVAEACSSGNGNKGTGGADGGSSSGGATGTGGKTDAGTGGMGTGGKTDAGTGGMGTGGKVDAGDSGTGGMGTGGMSSTTDASDAPKDMSVADTGTDVAVDVSVDADPAAPEKALCQTPMFMANITTTPFTAAQFCTLYMEICNNVVGATGFANEAACETAYTGYNTTPDADMSPTGQKGCRSYHLCNANNISLTVHCPHATGFANNDAGPGGPCP